MEGFGSVWGRLGASWAGLEPLNCVLDASWERLEGFWRRLEAIWVRLGGFGGRLEAPKAGPSLVRGGFGAVFVRFYRVFSRSKAKSEN